MKLLAIPLGHLEDKDVRKSHPAGLSSEAPH